MRIVVAILLLIGGLIGLGMTACGGIVTLMSLTEKNSGSMQTFAVASLIAGLLLLRLVSRQARKWRGQPLDTPPTLPPA